jgi:hypothetical protein
MLQKAMLKIRYAVDLQPNARDLGLDIRDDAVFAPERLRTSLESRGVRTADALAAALQSFPTVISGSAGLVPSEFAAGVAGALKKLRPHVDAAVLSPPQSQTRHGMGALPPDWLREREKSSSRG